MAKGHFLSWVIGFWVLALFASEQAFSKVDDSPLERNRKWGAFIEPSIGVAGGIYTNDTLGIFANLSDSAILIGPNLGLRAGAIYEYYFVSLDTEYSILPNSALPSSFSNFLFGITVGGTMGTIPLRFWLGVRLVDKLTINGLGTLDANSYKLGVGYFVQPLVAINLEVNIRDYGKVNMNGTLVAPSYKNIVLSVSVPFTFFNVKSMPEFSTKRYRMAEESSPF